MPADGVLDATATLAREADTHRCWVQPTGVGDDVTGVWFDVRVGERVLHEMVRNSVHAISSGCHGGGCGVCRIRVVEGEYTSRRMSRKHISESDEAAGVVLACRIVPTTDLVIEPAPAP